MVSEHGTVPPIVTVGGVLKIFIGPGASQAEANGLVLGPVIFLLHLVLRLAGSIFILINSGR